MAQYTPVNKWNKLGVQLKDFMKANLNSDNTFKKPVSQLLKEFSEIHRDRTTYGSTVYYYYNEVKFKLEDEIRNGNRSYNEPNTEETEAIEELGSKRSEVESMIDYIEGRTEYSVSDNSRMIIEEMIENRGVIETLIAIFDAIENVDNIDVFYMIVNEAKNKNKPLN